MYLNSIPAITDSEKASIFNQYFHSVFTSSSYVLPPMTFPTPNASLNNIDITEEDVFDALYSLDPSKASGPDGISQKIQKNFQLLSVAYFFTSFPSFLLSTLYHRNGESTVSLPSISQVPEIIFQTIGPYRY